MSSNDTIHQLLQQSKVHSQWYEILQSALQQVDSAYLNSLLTGQDWLPGPGKLFAAFQRDLENCKYILLGESPYPRRESANGIAFYDAAVQQLWSETGLSKPVNRATSLRNILKTALIAEKLIQTQADGKIPQQLIAAVNKKPLVSDIGQLFDNLQQRGFLMFNATPVLQPDRPPVKEARYWQGFIHQLLVEIKLHQPKLPTLVLWGKIAAQMHSITAADEYTKISSEHPYNLSFIHNPLMQEFFSSLNILQKTGPS